MIYCIFEMSNFFIFAVLFGQPFCNSARRAFACLTSDSSKIALIIGVGTFILTSIQLLVTASVTFVGIALFMVIPSDFKIKFCFVYFKNLFM